jgi:hypothetical protein
MLKFWFHKARCVEDKVTHKTLERIHAVLIISLLTQSYIFDTSGPIFVETLVLETCQVIPIFQKHVMKLSVLELSQIALLFIVSI